MRPDRIAELLQPYLSSTASCHSESGRRPGEEPAVLSSSQLDSISTYIDLLLRWNSRINLTAIRNEDEIVTRHFGESIFAARHLFPIAPGSVASLSHVTLADIGSGAGFPGIPIKLWDPNIALTLIESNHKKATFLREVARALTLTGVDIQDARAETIARTFEVVALRAVERFAEILPTAARLVADPGRIALFVGSGQLDETRSILPDFSWRAAIVIPGSSSRLLLIGQNQDVHHVG